MRFSELFKPKTKLINVEAKTELKDLGYSGTHKKVINQLKNKAVWANTSAGQSAPFVLDPMGDFSSFNPITQTNLANLISSGAISEPEAAILKEYICSANILIVGDPTAARKTVLLAIANEIKQNGKTLYFCTAEDDSYLAHDCLKESYSDEKTAYTAVKTILGTNFDKTIILDEVNSAEISLLLSSSCQWITTIQGYDTESALNNLEHISIKNGSYTPLKKTGY